MRLYGLPYIISALLAGCFPSSNAVDAQVRSAQRASIFRATATWRLSAANWSRSTPAMRDAAYRFCIARHGADSTCFHEQDYSLIAANHAETNARRAVRSKSDASFFDAIRSRPEAFDEARRYCFSVYRDAGAQDARMLGPCLSSATGSDFFSIIPVS
ncbi:hypothetical protein ASE65_12330 [Sphingomonas sp. Leaf16]|nr:hypothetical protein ASE65_12330 [Sphingomonas sp. Leaf16]KQN12772.1 hypothetical protein ASE81_05475 [Sphingomonas sp. Leaf29]KQN19660.1 hypothetical protein ASE83_05405 [Sphingomonas sp. Leaf32]